MNGTKKRYIVPILIMALVIIVVVSLVIYVTSKPSNYKRSFDEGITFGEVSYIVDKKIEEGEVTKEQQDEFDTLCIVCMVMPTPVNFRDLSEISGEILGDPLLKIPFREKTEISAFFFGASAKGYQLLVEDYYTEGKISQQEYNAIMIEYNELVNEPSAEKMEEFHDMVEKYLAEKAVEEGVGSLTARSFLYKLI